MFNFRAIKTQNCGFRQRHDILMSIIYFMSIDFLKYERIKGKTDLLIGLICGEDSYEDLQIVLSDSC